MVFDGFWDNAAAGQEFENVVTTLGEDITFLLDNGEEIKCKACFKNVTSSYSATLSKVYKFNGEILFPYNLAVETFRGLYFTRDAIPDKKYILASTSELQVSSILATVEAYECNKKISIGHLEKAYDSNLNEVEQFVYTYRDIDVFYDTSAKQPQTTKAGDIPQSIITLTIPSAYPVTTADYVLSNEYKSEGKNSPTTIYGEQQYDVIFVDDTFVTTIDEKNFYGVYKVDVVKDY